MEEPSFQQVQLQAALEYGDKQLHSAGVHLSGATDLSYGLLRLLGDFSQDDMENVNTRGDVIGLMYKYLFQKGKTSILNGVSYLGSDKITQKERMDFIAILKENSNDPLVVRLYMRDQLLTKEWLIFLTREVN